MLRFLKVLARNVLQGPATEAFPFGETHTPERFRGRVTMDPQKCVGCAICRHVCAGRAIRIEPNAEKTGYNFTIWHNTCALCGMCRHFCPTRAISMTNDWHNAHSQKDKFTWAEHHYVPYLRCNGCGTPIRMLPPELASRVYAHSPVDMTELMKLCPSCRQLVAARRLTEQTQTAEAAGENGGGNGNGEGAARPRERAAKAGRTREAAGVRPSATPSEGGQS